MQANNPVATNSATTLVGQTEGHLRGVAGREHWP